MDDEDDDLLEMDEYGVYNYTPCVRDVHIAIETAYSGHFYNKDRVGQAQRSIELGKPVANPHRSLKDALRGPHQSHRVKDFIVLNHPKDGLRTFTSDEMYETIDRLQEDLWAHFGGFMPDLDDGVHVGVLTNVTNEHDGLAFGWIFYPSVSFTALNIRDYTRWNTWWRKRTR